MPYNSFFDIASERFEAVGIEHCTGETFSMPGIYTPTRLMLSLFKAQQGTKIKVVSHDRYSEKWEIYSNGKKTHTYWLTNRKLGANAL